MQEKSAYVSHTEQHNMEETANILCLKAKCDNTQEGTWRSHTPPPANTTQIMTKFFFHILKLASFEVN